MADPLRLYGLNAVVTSAAGGIGEAVCRTLAKHGATVIAVDTPASGIDRHYERVKGIDGLEADLRDYGKMAALVDTAVGRLGGIDILVNEFPLFPPQPIATTGDELQPLLDTRSKLIESTSDAALPKLQRSPAGRIINIGFLRTVFAADGGAAYRAAEERLAEQTRSLAAAVGEYGVTANYVQPGAIMTPASRKVFGQDKAFRDRCIAASAARRLGEPVDVAKVVLFLASDDAVFVSGTGITVNGGAAD